MPPPPPRPPISGGGTHSLGPPAPCASTQKNRVRGRRLLGSTKTKTEQDCGTSTTTSPKDSRRSHAFRGQLATPRSKTLPKTDPLVSRSAAILESRQRLQVSNTTVATWSNNVLPECEDVEIAYRKDCIQRRSKPREPARKCASFQKSM